MISEIAITPNAVEAILKQAALEEREKRDSRCGLGRSALEFILSFGKWFADTQFDNIVIVRYNDKWERRICEILRKEGGKNTASLLSLLAHISKSVKYSTKKDIDTSEETVWMEEIESVCKTAIAKITSLQSKGFETWNNLANIPFKIRQTAFCPCKTDEDYCRAMEHFFHLSDFLVLACPFCLEYCDDSISLSVKREFERTLEILYHMDARGILKKIKTIHFFVNEFVGNNVQNRENELGKQAGYLLKKIEERIRDIPCHVHIVKKTPKDRIVDRRWYFGRFQNNPNERNYSDAQYKILWGASVSHYFQQNVESNESGAAVCLTEKADVKKAQERFRPNNRYATNTVCHSTLFSTQK